jgi:hypothetical protein
MRSHTALILAALPGAGLSSTANRQVFGKPVKR